MGLSSAVLGPSFGRLLGCLLGRLGGRPSKNARTLKPFKNREKIIGGGPLGSSIGPLLGCPGGFLSRIGAILGHLGALSGRHGGHWKGVGIPRSFWDGSEEAPGTLSSASSSSSSSSPPFTFWGPLGLSWDGMWSLLSRFGPFWPRKGENPKILQTSLNNK